MSTTSAEHVDHAPGDGGEYVELTSRSRVTPFSDAARRLYSTQTFIIGYLGEAARSHAYSSGKGIYSFSKEIPRRAGQTARKPFEGNYMELAHQTLVAARGAETNASPGGIIHLLGSGIESRYLQPQDEGSTMVTVESVEAASFYQSSVAALVWKAGFVRYPRGEDAVPYGEGEINTSAEIYKTPVSPYNQELTHISIPFEPANPLHRLLIPPTANENNRWRLELTMPSNISYGGRNEADPYLNLQFVELPPVQEQIAA